MPSGDKRDPQARTSTDQGLRTERERTDAELASRSADIRGVASQVVADARNKADEVLSDARDREDLKVTASPSITAAREREDAVLETARSGADLAARDEREQQQVALASLLTLERHTTDLRLESERVRADQALTSREDFMAMVSHDLRGLLGGIALSAEILRDVGDVENPLDKVRLYAERIQRFSARMNRLVCDLMDLASIEAGKLGLVRVRRNAGLLLRDAHDAFEPATRAQGIELRCEPHLDLGVAELDHERLLQVLTNLVGNALKFTPSGGRIEIRMERHGSDLHLQVSDTGIGISAELLSKIFERYYQSDHGNRRGLGLGLFISKSIVEGHGGQIWAESVPGQGTTFHVTLPAPIVAVGTPILT
jgi:signal transduction histidine kinase